MDCQYCGRTVNVKRDSCPYCGGDIKKGNVGYPSFYRGRIINDEEKIDIIANKIGSDIRTDVDTLRKVPRPSPPPKEADPTFALLVLLLAFLMSLLFLSPIWGP